MLAAAVGAAGQEPHHSTLTVRVSSEGEPVPGARVTSGGTGALTNDRGEALLRLDPGRHAVRVEAVGLKPALLAVTIRAAADTLVVVQLEPEPLEGDAIIVSSTRADRRIEDEPIRVEVIGREEIEEKLLMTPGDISMLLNETAGLRVQPTAPTLGGAGVRIQGMRGRYTQIRTDGLLLHGQTDALGPLQIPPMDLAQVEVIKGATSALYGASALGGVVNLISRRPGDENERELLLNVSTLGGADLILWNSGPIGGTWAYTMLAGAHRQAAADVDDDGWADLPRFDRASARPRLFWSNGRGGTAMFTAGLMVEEREGGTVRGGSTPGASPHAEALVSHRFDAGAVSRLLLFERTLLSVRGSVAFQDHTHRFGQELEKDEHSTVFAEAAVTRSTGPHAAVVGIALQRDTYHARELDVFDYAHTVPGLFGQADISPSRWVSMSASGRLDHHSEYGTFFSPRVSALLRPAEAWTVRASAGTGYFAPTPWSEEAEAVGLRRVAAPERLAAERARTASLDVGRTFGALELNATVFGSRIADPVQARVTTDGLIQLVNAAGTVRTRGTELLARYHVEGLHVTATHVYLQAREPDPDGAGRREVPLTPRHTAGLVAAWEQEERGRAGVEFYYTGRQALEGNPYRDTSEPHVIVGFLMERRVGPARVFLNAENIFDTRQTRYDPLLLPARSPEGRWTTDVWAPLEGRAFNAGVRWEF
jgi:outer membrane receptor for ferrienterochelin and colicins